MNHNLKEAILTRGLKQKFVARAMNMEPVTFSKKLIGDLSFSRSEQRQISKILRVKIKDIFPDITDIGRSRPRDRRETAMKESFDQQNDVKPNK